MLSRTGFKDTRWDRVVLFKQLDAYLLFHLPFNPASKSSGNCSESARAGRMNFHARIVDAKRRAISKSANGQDRDVNHG